MGARSNIVVVDDDSKVYFYAHSLYADDLEPVLAAALRRGESRWDDGPYLARIIFAEMVRDDLDGLTGYGISSVLMDGDETFVINVRLGTVNGVPIPSWLLGVR